MEETVLGSRLSFLAFVLFKCGGTGLARYVKMPPVEEPLAGYLSQGEASSLKAPSLPSKPCQTTSWLVGKVYVAAGQADGALGRPAQGLGPGTMIVS